MFKRQKLSKRALVLLRSYGISKKAALYAGLFSVENAKSELNGKAVPLPDGSIIPYYPRVKGLDWSTYMNGSNAIVVFDDELRALKSCLDGVPAVAIVGVSKERAAEWLRERGANVIDKSSAH